MIIKEGSGRQFRFDPHRVEFLPEIKTSDGVVYVPKEKVNIGKRNYKEYLISAGYRKQSLTYYPERE